MRSQSGAGTWARQANGHMAPGSCHAVGCRCRRPTPKPRGVPVLLLVVTVLLLGTVHAKGATSGGSRTSTSTSTASSGTKTSTSTSTSSSSSSSISSSSSSIAAVSGKTTVSGTSKWYGGSSTTSSGSTTYVYPSTTYYAYRTSYGMSTTGARVAGVTILSSYIFLNSNSYPGIRFYYNDTNYYDDCALRNATAAQLGLNDTAVDITTVNALPQLIPDASTADILAFNATLYNATNGLVIDPDYCNYNYDNTTTTAAPLSGAAGLGLRRCGGLASMAALLAVAAAAWVGL